MSNLNEILTRGVVNIIPDKNRLEEVLSSGKKLNIYFGIDPTATRIHIGHAVPIRKLQALLALGHNITFLIGDFTALIGDTSDKDTERPILTYEQIQENFKTYKQQAEKILDFSKVKVAFNSQWLRDLKFEDIIKLCQNFSVGDFVGRELIRKRLDAGQPVKLHETLYPVMQGYDSYHLDTDIQIGSADQTFNMQAGRTLIKNLSGKDSFVLVTDYLAGTDGRKMSKSWGNAIWLSDEPVEMFGKIMSLRDELIIQYFTLATSAPTEQIEKHKEDLESGRNPMELKIALATLIVSEIHGQDAASSAKLSFEKTFQNKSPEYDTQTTASASDTIVDVVAKVVGSKSEAKRLISQKAVDINDQTVVEVTTKLNDGDKIKIGKKQFFTVKINNE